jgi:hypothetical protein
LQIEGNIRNTEVICLFFSWSIFWGSMVSLGIHEYIPPGRREVGVEQVDEREEIVFCAS